MLENFLILDDYVHETVEANILQEIIKHTLIKEISKLPKKQKEFIMLYFYNGLTVPSIAVRLKITREHCYYIKEKALSRLRKNLTTLKLDKLISTSQQ